MKLPNPFRRDKPRGGVSVPRGEIPVPGQASFADRLRALGVPAHDPLGDAYRAGTFGSTSSGGGLPHPHVVAGDELPPGSKVTRAPSVVERFQDGDDGTVWNG